MKKKILGIILVVSLLTPCIVCADDMGVKIIGGEDTEDNLPVSLDDIKIGKEAEIDGYGVFLATSFSYKDSFEHFKRSDSENRTSYVSGQDAEYAMLRADVTNISTTSRDFLAQCSVKVVYDDKYEYEGWYDQYDYNHYIYYNSTDATEIVTETEGRFAIDPMYDGHYVFGCTLPNKVVDGKAPLRMEIELDGNDITYHIRK